MKGSYKVGQVVSLRLPRTYGVISEILKGPVFDDEPIYDKGGLIVEPINPLRSISGELQELDYYFENPLFDWMVQVVDPVQEIIRIRQLGKKDAGADGINLEEAIGFLSIWVRRRK